MVERNPLEYLQQLIDALNRLGVGMGILTEHLRWLLDLEKSYELVFNEDGVRLLSITRSRDGRCFSREQSDAAEEDDGAKKLREADCICDAVADCIEKIWMAEEAAQRLLGELPEDVHEKLSQLVGKPWRAVVRRQCLDQLRSWPAQTKEDAWDGVVVWMSRRVEENLKKSRQSPPFDTWRKYSRLLREYKLDLIAMRGEVGGRESVLVVSTDPPQATLRGVPYALEPDWATFLGKLAENPGLWISSTEFRKDDLITRPERIRDRLPKPLLALVESKKGTGHRIPKEKLA